MPTRFGILALVIAMLIGPAVFAQTRSAEEKAVFILHVSDFASRFDMNRQLRQTAILQAIAADKTLAAKFSPRLRKNWERSSRRSLLNQNPSLSALLRGLS